MKYLLLFLSILCFGFRCDEENYNPYAELSNSNEWENGVQTGKLQGDFADEMSGMAASIMNPGLYWIHNDGSIKKLFLIDTLGNKFAELILPTSIAFSDVEDISCGMLNGSSTIFIADIGDNELKRSAYSIHKLQEPVLTIGEKKIIAQDEISSIDFSFANNQSYNCESLLFDPMDASLILLSKSNPTLIFEFSANLNGLFTNFQPLAELPIESPTSACISSDGRRTIIRTSTSTYIFSNQPGISLRQQLSLNLPMLGPTLLETKGEAICFNLSSSGFLTCSESAGTSNQPIYYYKRK